MEAAPHDRSATASWATGAAMMISKAAADEVGPWDETLLLYGEEVEYTLRAADHGWSLWFTPKAVMSHVGGTQTVTNPELFALLTVNRIRVFRQRHGAVSSAAYLAAVLLGELLRAIAGRRTARTAVVALLRPTRRLRALPC
jgi:GT2 family glycosyltransferase